MKLLKSSYLFIFLLYIISSCNAQEKKKEKTVHSEKTIGVNPKISVKANKQYDEKGNLIKLDSTYSYFYSSKGKDSSKVSLDSMVQHFKSIYNKDLSNLMDKRFKDLFLNDSLFKYDFFNEDYFTKRIELNQQLMDSLFMQMDSVKNIFLKQPLEMESKKKSVKK